MRKWLTAALLLLTVATTTTALVVVSPRTSATTITTTRCHHGCVLYSTKPDSATDAFSAFAESLEQQQEEEEEETQSWQSSLEELLDPSTNPAQRQTLLSDLLSANEEIRESVSAALRDRKIDPLLTPTGKKLQDGTRAVARQITTDILPGIASSPPKAPADLPLLIPKVGSSIFNAFANQAKRNLEMLQSDLQDPSRIPQRLSETVETVKEEARNVFKETPEGYRGPQYTVVSVGEGYEIRQYQGYKVASTSMAKVGEPYTVDDIASGGAAFNTLAAYLFGANTEKKTLAMTTPVTTTSLGEMRFYLQDDAPEPLEESSSNGVYEKGAVQLVEVPPARLAVARFTGFVTEGEVTRQKDALLAHLATDGIEIDVPHGAVVPHVVFQYNPPYTIPIVRRNEIAVPVMANEDEDSNQDKHLETEWLEEENGKNDGGGGAAPSDVE